MYLLWIQVFIATELENSMKKLQKLDHVEVIIVSMDLPFAMKRFLCN